MQQTGNELRKYANEMEAKFTEVEQQTKKLLGTNIKQSKCAYTVMTQIKTTYFTRL